MKGVKLLQRTDDACNATNGVLNKVFTLDVEKGQHLRGDFFEQNGDLLTVKKVHARVVLARVCAYACAWVCLCVCLGV